MLRDKKLVAFTLYPGVTPLDLVGPLTVLRKVGPGWPFRTVVVGERLEAVPEPLPPRPPERRVPALEEQLGWLGEAGFVSVDCYWRTLPLALFGGFRPLPAP